MDGNTRLCTATAAAALKETFGADGQPGCYTDIDALRRDRSSTATTSPRRRRCCGPGCSTGWPARTRRRMVCVDPRPTPGGPARPTCTSPLRPGTNLALMNGLLRELIAQRLGRPRLRRRAHRRLRRAAARPSSRTRRSGSPRSAGSTAGDVRARRRDLRHQRAGAVHGAAGLLPVAPGHGGLVQVNNLHLLRGMLGRPGAGILPDERPAHRAEQPGDRRRRRPVRVSATGRTPSTSQQLADLWDVDAASSRTGRRPRTRCRSSATPSRARSGSCGSPATNPAVSLPDLAADPAHPRAATGCSSSCRTASCTETAELADVVLPAALWGEKTGTFTNVDRTVHLSEQAVDPPGEARSDLEICLDYARRMGFRDRDGRPLIRAGTTPEEAFEAGRSARAAGRATTPACLRAAARQRRHPVAVHRRAPEGTERLYTDGALRHRRRLLRDLRARPAHRRRRHAEQSTGAKRSTAAPLLGAPSTTSRRPRSPTDDYPLGLTTGRTVYHFHTRTKTGRAPQLDAAAPDAVGRDLARGRRRPGIAEGDLVRVESRARRASRLARAGQRHPPGRGVRAVPLRLLGRPRRGRTRTRAANELTITEWDPVSKQPAVQGRRRASRGRRRRRHASPAPTTTASAPSHVGRHLGSARPRRRDGRTDAMHLAPTSACCTARRPTSPRVPGGRRGARRRGRRVCTLCELLARQCDRHAERLAPVPSATARSARTSPSGCTRTVGHPHRAARPAARPAGPLPAGGRATSPGPSSARPPRGCATRSCSASCSGARGDRHPALVATHPDEGGRAAGAGGGRLRGLPAPLRQGGRARG